MSYQIVLFNDYSRWNQEPNDWLGNEDCASLTGSGNYNDMDCTSQTGFICEYVNLFYNSKSIIGLTCR